MPREGRAICHLLNCIVVVPGYDSLSLTPAARELEQVITREVSEQIGELTDRLSPAEQKRLSTLLRRLIE